MSQQQIVLKKHSIIPGFGLTMGYTLMYVGFFVLIPLSTIFVKTFGLGWEQLWDILSAPRMVASYKLSFGAAFLAAFINAVFGLIIAWVLVRYPFPGKRLIDGLVDLPFALPTAVAGITLTTLYAPSGWLGKWFAFCGIKVAYSPWGVVIALTFIGLPFVVRMIQPVLQTLDPEVEEAAASLGAGRFQTFVKVIFPELVPSLLTGFALAFARALGEYGSVVFISGNMPMQTEITPLLIMTKLEQYDYSGASAIACGLLVVSFVILFFINVLQWWSTYRYVRN